MFPGLAELQPDGRTPNCRRCSSLRERRHFMQAREVAGDDERKFHVQLLPDTRAQTRRTVDNPPVRLNRGMNCRAGHRGRVQAIPMVRKALRSPRVFIAINLRLACQNSPRLSAARVACAVAGFYAFRVMSRSMLAEHTL